MNYYFSKMIIFICLSLSLSANILQDQKIGAGLKVGTLGFGLDVYKEVYKDLNLRLNINYFSLKRSQELNGITYALDFNLFTTGLLLDYYMLENNFRGTFGLYYNGNKLSGKADIGDKNIKIGDTTYTANDIGDVDLTLDFQKISPYFGIGWGGHSSDESGFSFGFDMGVMYHGKPKASITFKPKNKSISEIADIQGNINKEIAKECSVFLNYQF